MANDLTVLSAESRGIAYAIIFGVEHYMEAKLERVSYAEKDATSIRDELVAVDYNPANIEVILSSKATKTTIEYEVTQLAKTAKKGDCAFIFFAGHGYHQGGRNFLLAHDTRLGDVEGTSVALELIFTLFENSECRQVMFFLDCCHSGMRLHEGARGILESLSSDELKHYFDLAEFRVIFSACGDMNSLGLRLSFSMAIGHIICSEHYAAKNQGSSTAGEGFSQLSCRTTSESRSIAK